MGRGFRKAWEGASNNQLFLYRRKPDFLNGRRPLFFTVAVDGVMHRMTVGMVETARRKTRFPTVGTTIHAKAKPPSATRFFVFISSPSQTQYTVGRTRNSPTASSSNSEPKVTGAAQCVAER